MAVAVVQRAEVATETLNYAGPAGAPTSRMIGLLVRVTLGLNALMFLLQMTWSQLPRVPTPEQTVRLRPLVLATAVFVALWLVSLIRIAVLRRGLGPFLTWITRSSLRSWLAAFAAFEACLAFGVFLAEQAVVTSPAVFMGAAGFFTALSLLLAHELRPNANPPQKRSPLSPA